MSIYSENMAAIERRYPATADLVKKTKDDYSVKVIPSKVRDMPTCTIGTGTREDEIILNSVENPLAEAEAYMAAVVGLEKKAGMIILFNMGFGYYLQAIFGTTDVNSKLIGGAPVVVIEPNVQLFKKMLQTRNLMLQVNGQHINLFDYEPLSVFVGVPVDQMYAALTGSLQGALKQQFAGMEYIEHPKLIRQTKGYFKPLYSELSRVFYDIRSSFGNDPEDSWSGIDHQFQNISTIVENQGVVGLKGKFKGIPAVIAATGPSLNKNIHLLNSIKNKAVFFAADASLNTFLKYDEPIKPDIVCSLERNLTTKRHFEQIPDDKKSMMEDMWLAGCPVVKPEVYKEWHGKHIIVFRDFAHFKWLGLNKGIVNTGKSVTNLAFMVAHEMGCSPIILVGQDLAFAPSGDTHVKGADHAREGLKESKLILQKQKCKGNNGEDLDTLDTWVGMRRRFEQDIATIGMKCINATEGGALIKGTEVMTFQQTIDQFMKKDYPIQRMLSENLPELEENEIAEDLKIVDTNVRKGLEYYRVSLDNINIAKDCIEDFCGTIMSGEYSKDSLQKILEYGTNLKREILEHEMCYHAAMHVVQSWTLGRSNVVNAINRVFNGDERLIAKLLKMHEFFEGLEILFKKLNEGVRANYDTEKPEVSSLWNGIDYREYLRFEFEAEGLDMQKLQAGQGEEEGGGGEARIPGGHKDSGKQDGGGAC